MLVAGSATGTTIQGNSIGTTADGTGALGNSQAGIYVGGVDNTTIGGPNSGDGNVISGNDVGIVVGSGAQGTKISGNEIGTNANGTAALAGSEWGILDNGDGTVIGGPAAGDRNLISGNPDDGIGVSDSGGATIEGNWIGIDSTGNHALGNAGAGIRVESGTATITENVISGNDEGGIDVPAGSATIKGNVVGTDPTGSSALGNGADGIDVTSSDNTIGGAGSDANVISGNSGDGVRVSGGSGNAIRKNSIYGNGNLGIDLQNGSNNRHSCADSRRGAGRNALRQFHRRQQPAVRLRGLRQSVMQRAVRERRREDVRHLIGELSRDIRDPGGRHGRRGRDRDCHRREHERHVGVLQLRHSRRRRLALGKPRPVDRQARRPDRGRYHRLGSVGSQQLGRSAGVRAHSERDEGQRRSGDQRPEHRQRRRDGDARLRRLFGFASPVQLQLDGRGTGRRGPGCPWRSHGAGDRAGTVVQRACRHHAAHADGLDLRALRCRDPHRPSLGRERAGLHAGDPGWPGQFSELGRQRSGDLHSQLQSSERERAPDRHADGHRRRVRSLRRRRHLCGSPLRRRQRDRRLGELQLRLLRPDVRLGADLEHPARRVRSAAARGSTDPDPERTTRPYPARADAARPHSARAHAARPDAARPHPAGADAARSHPARPHSARAHPARTYAAGADTTRTDAAGRCATGAHSAGAHSSSPRPGSRSTWYRSTIPLIRTGGATSSRGHRSPGSRCRRSPSTRSTR